MRRDKGVPCGVGGRGVSRVYSSVPHECILEPFDSKRNSRTGGRTSLFPPRVVFISPRGGHVH